MFPLTSISHILLPQKYILTKFYKASDSNIKATFLQPTYTLQVLFFLFILYKYLCKFDIYKQIVILNYSKYANNNILIDVRLPISHTIDVQCF